MSILDFIPKLGLTKLVISEDDIYVMVKNVLNRPILQNADSKTKAGVSIAISSLVESLKDKEILTTSTVDEVNEILSQWVNA